MISAWHLLWIIPLSNLISMFTVGLCRVGAKSDNLSEAYSIGLKSDNLSEAYSIGFRDGRAYRDKETADGDKT